MDQEVPQVNEPHAVPENVPRVEVVFTPIKKQVTKYDWNEMFKKGKFKKEDMSTMVMDFLVNKELAIVAETFHKESGCPMGIEDLSILGTQGIVRDFIKNRMFDEAINYVNEKLGSIFLMDRPLIHFYLEQQKMIEMCPRCDFEAALAFSREFIRWQNVVIENKDMKNLCRKTLLLMLFGDDKKSPVAGFLNQKRCFVLGNEVVDEMMKFQGRKTGSALETAVKILSFEQHELNKVANFPNFNRVTGYPERLPPGYVHTWML